MAAIAPAGGQEKARGLRLTVLDPATMTSVVHEAIATDTSVDPADVERFRLFARGDCGDAEC